MLQITRFLLVLVAVTQSAALTISVLDNLIPGQIAKSQWTRAANEPSSYTAALHSLSKVTKDVLFRVDSNGKLKWEFEAQIPSNLPAGSYVVYVSAGRGTKSVTSNTFTVGPSASPPASPPPAAGGGAGGGAGASASTQPEPPTSAPQNETPLAPTPSTSLSLTQSLSGPSGSNTIATLPSDTGRSQTSTTTPVTGGVSVASNGPPDTPSGTTPPPTAADVNTAASSPTTTGTAINGATSSSNKSAVIGSVIGSLLAIALIAIITVIIVRRYRRKQETVQFYEHKMVRPREYPDPSQSSHSYGQSSYSYGTANTVGHSYPHLPPQTTTGYPEDVKREPEPLPAYGYSNIDIVEKADYYRHYPDAGTGAPLPSGPMPR